MFTPHQTHHYIARAKTKPSVILLTFLFAAYFSWWLISRSMSVNKCYFSTSFLADVDNHVSSQPWCSCAVYKLMCWSLSMLCCKTVHLFSLLSAVSFCADRSSTFVSVDILWLLILSKYMLCTVSILTWLNTMSAQGNKCQI